MPPVYRDKDVDKFYFRKGQHGSVAPLEEGCSARPRFELAKMPEYQTNSELEEIFERSVPRRSPQGVSPLEEELLEPLAASWGHLAAILGPLGPNPLFDHKNSKSTQISKIVNLNCGVVPICINYIHIYSDNI